MRHPPDPERVKTIDAALLAADARLESGDHDPKLGPVYLYLAGFPRPGRDTYVVPALCGQGEIRIRIPGDYGWEQSYMYRTLLIACLSAAHWYVDNDPETLGWSRRVAAGEPTRRNGSPFPAENQ